MSNRTKQLLSILVSLVVYIACFNWKVSLLLVISIAFHEQCHCWAAKKAGLSAGIFYLIPFVGGATPITSRYKRYSQQAFTAIMGPVGGGILAMVVAGFWLLTGWPWLAASASFMCLINSANLLIIPMLDGQRVLETICGSLDKTLGLVIYTLSYAFSCALIFHFSPMVAMICFVISGTSLVKEFGNWNAYRQGKTWLCTDAYLCKPIALTCKEIALTITTWTITMVILITTMLYLNTQFIR